METQTPLPRLAESIICAIGFVWSLSASAEPFAYITNVNTNLVAVMDTATNTVVDTILVGDMPIGVAVHPDGSTVYVANRNGNSISVIDTTTNAVVATVGVGRNPQGVALLPDGGLVYVTNEGDNSISVIDPATNSVVDTVGVGAGPYGVAVHPDGSSAYVANESRDTVSVIDTTTNTVVDTVLVGDGPAAFGQLIGPIGPLPSNVGGFATGLSLRFAVCRNLTTGSAVQIFIPEGENSWDCTAAGLEVLPGDTILMIEAGIAE